VYSGLTVFFLSLLLTSLSSLSSLPLLPTSPLPLLPPTPLQYIGAAHNYPSTVSAKAAIYALGREIQHGSIPKILGPLVFVFTGSGNVSKVSGMWAE